jgi:hypothetical protein
MGRSIGAQLRKSAERSPKGERRESIHRRRKKGARRTSAFQRKEKPCSYRQTATRSDPKKDFSPAVKKAIGNL